MSSRQTKTTHKTRRASYAELTRTSNKSKSQRISYVDRIRKVGSLFQKHVPKRPDGPVRQHPKTRFAKQKQLGAGKRSRRR